MSNYEDQVWQNAEERAPSAPEWPEPIVRAEAIAEGRKLYDDWFYCDESHQSIAISPRLLLALVAPAEVSPSRSETSSLREQIEALQGYDPILQGNPWGDEAEMQTEMGPGAWVRRSDVLALYAAPSSRSAVPPVTWGAALWQEVLAHAEGHDSSTVVEALRLASTRVWESGADHEFARSCDPDAPDYREQCERFDALWMREWIDLLVRAPVLPFCCPRCGKKAAEKSALMGHTCKAGTPEVSPSRVSREKLATALTRAVMRYDGFDDVADALLSSFTIQEKPSHPIPEQEQ